MSVDGLGSSTLVFFPVLKQATSVTKVGVWLCLSGGSFLPVVSGITPVVPTASSCCRTGSTLGLTRALVQVACSSLHWPDPDGVGLSALQYPSLARSDE